MAKTNLLAMALERPKRERPSKRDELVRSIMAKQAFASEPVHSVGYGLTKVANAALLGYLDRKQDRDEQGERERLADMLFGSTPGGGTSTTGQGSKLAKVLKGEKIAPSADSFTEQVVAVESGGDPNARNPRSSAAGPGQFIDSTWREFIADQHPQLLASGQDIGALRSDPDLARQAVDWYGNQNAQFLEGRGLPVNEATKYLAHFAGPGGAEAVLSASPDAPVRDILGQQAMEANPFLAGMTAADLTDWARRKMGVRPRVQPAGVETGGVEPQTVPDPQAINLRREFEPDVGGVGNAYIDMMRQQQAQSGPPAPDAGRIAPNMPQQPFAAPEAPQGATDPMQEQVGLLSAIPMEEQVVLRQMVESGEIQPFQVLQYARELRAEQQPEYVYETMPDGTLLQINKRDGSVQPVYESGPKQSAANLATLELPDGTKRTFDLGTPDGRSAAQQLMAQGATEVRTPATQVNIGQGMETPGRKKVDENFAETYEGWVTGGFADVNAQISQLDEVARGLEAGGNFTGPMIGAAETVMPESLFAQQFPDALAARDAVTEVAQRSLREILGAQFTEKEGERLIARTYNMNASPQENAKRVRRLVEKIKAMAAAKQATVEYFNEHGTLTGYEGKIPSLDDLAEDTERPKRLRYNPETGTLEEVQ